MDASPIRLALGTIGLFLLLLLFVYMAARLAVWGGAKSWSEFWKDKQNNKEERNDREKKNNARLDA
jgi:hypothetical protein